MTPMSLVNQFSECQIVRKLKRENLISSMSKKTHLQNKIELELSIKCKDNFLSHFHTFFRYDFNSWYGEITDDGFKAWSLSQRFGIFYPVITGSIRENNEGIKVILRPELNIIAKILGIVLFILFTFCLILANLRETDTYYGGDQFMQIAISALLYICTLSIVYIAYRDVKRRKLNIFCETILKNGEF